MFKIYRDNMLAVLIVELIIGLGIFFGFKPLLNWYFGNIASLSAGMIIFTIFGIPAIIAIIGSYIEMLVRGLILSIGEARWYYILLQFVMVAFAIFTVVWIIK